MGVLDLLLGRDPRALGVAIEPTPRGAVAPWSPGYYSPYDAVWVGDRSALSVPAVASAIDLIAGIVSATPFAARMKRDNVLLDPQPMVVSKPDPGLTRQEALYEWISAYLLRGEMYLRLYATDGGGFPQAITLLPNDFVEPFRTSTGIKKFRYGTEELTEKEVRHVKWFSIPGEDHGFGPIQLARQTIAGHLASSEFTRRLFTDGGIVTSVLRHPLALDEQEAKDLKAQWVNAMSGTREPAVLSGGVDYAAISPNLVDMSLVDLRREGILDVCRLFHLPPAVLAAEMAGSSLTYQNVGQLYLSVLRLQQPLYSKFEAIWTEQIPPDQYIYADLDFWLRPDPRGQLDAVIAAVTAGLFTVEEGRTRLGISATPDSVRTVSGSTDQ